MAEVDLLLAMVPALKIGIYLGILILTFLLAVVYKKSISTGGLKVMSVAFMLAAVFEFLHVMNEAHLDHEAEHGAVFSLFGNEPLVEFLIHLVFFIGGLGLLWYVNGVRKNIKDYK